MKPVLSVLAVVLIAAGFLLAAGTAGVWFGLGAHTGWSRSYVEIPSADPITGIEFSKRVERFVPGLDVLVPGAAGGFICIFSGVVILMRTKKS